MLDLEDFQKLVNGWGNNPVASKVHQLIAEVEEARRYKRAEVEVWPVGLQVEDDEPRIYLLSGLWPWRSEPMQVDAKVHAYAELEVIRHQAIDGLAVLHQTSCRDCGAVEVLTYLAVIKVRGLVKSTWPDALPVSPKLPGAIGKPPTHGGAEAPKVRDSDVLLHALRHLKFLTDPESAGYDEQTAKDLRKAHRAWPKGLAPWRKDLYRLFRSDDPAA